LVGRTVSRSCHRRAVATAPDGSVFGTVRAENIGPSGHVDGFPIDTVGLLAGMWNVVFQGTSSHHQSIVYFKISKP
jgi:hypothetical protein